MSPVIFFNLIMGIIGSFQVFTAGFLHDRRRPAKRDPVLRALHLSQRFPRLEMGYASALAWVLFLIILVLTLLTFKYLADGCYYEEPGRRHGNETRTNSSAATASRQSGRLPASQRRASGARIMWLVLLAGVGMFMSCPSSGCSAARSRPSSRSFEFPPQFIPDPVMLENYVAALTYKPFGLYLAQHADHRRLNVIAVLLSASFVRLRLCAHPLPRPRFLVRHGARHHDAAVLVIDGAALHHVTALGWIDTLTCR